jgi:VanZ family protein
MTLSRWVPVVGWAGVILTATSLPNVPAPPAAGSDKLAHLAMYAVLGFLWLRAATTGVVAPRTLILTLAAIAVFGAADEWHQQFVPDRSADPADWVADVAGAALGMGALVAFKLRRIKGT